MKRILPVLWMAVPALLVQTAMAGEAGIASEDPAVKAARSLDIKIPVLVREWLVWSEVPYAGDSESPCWAHWNDDGVIPVAVKEKNGATASFDRALRSSSVPYGYKFISGNVGVMEGKIPLPHYMAMFMRPVA